MALPDFSKYKPDPVWGVTDDEWECAILRRLRNDVYTRELNMYTVQKVKANVLDSIVPPVLLSTRKGRRKGKWRQKPGISLTDERPNYIRSLATYGDLFFETTMGKHKEWKDDPGRGKGMAGQFVILWECDVFLYRGQHQKCSEIYGMQYYNSLATAYALIEEAKTRGDHVTFLVEPGTIDDLVPWHKAARRAPKIPIHYVSPPRWEIRNDPSMAEPVRSQTSEASIRDACRERMHISGWMVYPQDVAPTGKFTSRFRKDIEDNIFNTLKTDTGSVKEPILSGYYYWKDSTEYDEMLNELLDFYFPSNEPGLDYGPMRTMAWPMFGIAALEEMMRSVPTYDKRGTFIFLTGVQNMDWTYGSFNYLRRLSKKFDIYVMDVGEHDWSNVFQREPDFKKDGRPYMNYINVSNLVKITVSQHGSSTFSDLQLIVQRHGTGGVNERTEVTVDYNSSAKFRTYSSVNYPTIAQLVTAIQRDFMELDVKRLTVPGFKTVELTEKTIKMSWADGCVMLSGYDVENFTYKLLKAIGAKVNGIAVT